MPGARRARSLACKVESTRVSHHGHTGITRHSPRNGFNGFLRALPGDRLIVTVAGGLRLVRTRSGRLTSANLTPAPGRQDHTTSPSANSVVVSSPLMAHRLKPALPSHRAPDAARVHRIPRPTSVTIAKRPSEGTGRREF
jgi:hypothetical protein